RLLGAWGFPAPYGHQPAGAADVSFNLDIVGGATDALAAAMDQVTTSGRPRVVGGAGNPKGPAESAEIRVNLLFDHETPAVKVESPYTGGAGGAGGALRVTPRSAGPLSVRLPAWADPTKVTVEGAAGPPVLAGGYLTFTGGAAGRPVTLRFDRPARELTLRHRARDVRVRLRGDEVVGMDRFGTDLSFFDPYE
ncbi:MAG: hypothetical protein JWO31_2944, partial [Phycisphaerales bacterium]|nr:hypothetical protein [Phycisphaerales bacterium]